MDGQSAALFVFASSLTHVTCHRETAPRAITLLAEKARIVRYRIIRDFVLLGGHRFAVHSLSMDHDCSFCLAVCKYLHAGPSLIALSYRHLHLRLQRWDHSLAPPRHRPRHASAGQTRNTSSFSPRALSDQLSGRALQPDTDAHYENTPPNYT